MSPRAPDQSYEDFVMEHLPWLTGSLGTVLLDFTVSTFWEKNSNYYGANKETKMELKQLHLCLNLFLRFCCSVCV